jgi:hypothetical protein
MFGNFLSIKPPSANPGIGHEGGGLEEWTSKALEQETGK